MTTAPTRATASPTRKTPVRDAVKKASSDIKKVVTKASDSIKSAMSGGQDDKNGWERAKRGKPAESAQPRCRADPRMRAVGQGGNDGSE